MYEHVCRLDADAVRRGMIQLAWRFLMFQKQSALVQCYQRQTADARGGTRKIMIVALARKLLVALWRLVTIGGNSGRRGSASGSVRRRGGADDQARLGAPSITSTTRCP
jgi:hypothetical protein